MIRGPATASSRSRETYHGARSLCFDRKQVKEGDGRAANPGFIVARRPSRAGPRGSKEGREGGDHIAEPGTDWRGGDAPSHPHDMLTAPIRACRAFSSFNAPALALTCLLRGLVRPSAQRREMKLLTHNMLQCHIKGVKNGYPFQIEASKITEKEADFDPGTATRTARVAMHALLAGCCRQRALGQNDTGLEPAIASLPFASLAWGVAGAQRSCSAVARLPTARRHPLHGAPPLPHLLTPSARCSTPSLSDFLRHIFPRIQWPAFVQAATSVSSYVVAADVRARWRVSLLY